MAATIGDRERELLQKPNFAHVATLRKDGSVHAVVVWVDVDGDRVLLNSSEGRAWPANVQRDPRITITVPNQENPYEFVSIRGRVVETTPEGADEHIDALAKKYLGQDTYPYRQEGEVRLKIVVEPERVALQGG
jgi:PPOX class probable F420-dependent enzyme